ncbi:MAG: leucine-rich repeat domain-containing protein [Mycoplasmataceae bacterium]|nr:leucine-rich repeat domain-containing protein [Mycoplasmataceae bacterium]
MFKKKVNKIFCWIWIFTPVLGTAFTISCSNNERKTINWECSPSLVYSLGATNSVLITSDLPLVLDRTTIWLEQPSFLSNALELDSFNQHTNNSISFTVRVKDTSTPITVDFLEFTINVQTDKDKTIYRYDMYLIKQPTIQIQKKTGQDGPLDKTNTVTYGANVNYPWGDYLHWNWDVTMQPVWISFTTDYYDKTITITNNNTDVLDFSEITILLTATYGDAIDTININFINSNSVKKIPFNLFEISDDGIINSFNSSDSSLVLYDTLVIPQYATYIKPAVFKEKLLPTTKEFNVIFNSNSLCTTIDVESFAGNANIKNVYFSQNITEIKDLAFANDTNIAQLHFKTFTPPHFESGTKPFANCNKIETVYVPAGAKEAYLPYISFFNITDSSKIQEE